MIHNGIEYGLMQSYAEGLAVLKKKQEFGLDLAQVSAIWQHGSVVRSWLLDLTAEALAENPEMDGIAPFVADSGEGRWTVFEAIDLDVPAWTMTAALFERFRSRDKEAYYDRLLAAMRAKFGGHAVRKEG
jgi:6-phosphogluconate dehydrogenase